MQTPEMKWWPAGVFSSATSYQHGTAPAVQYLTRRGPVLFAAQWRGKSASAKPTIILYRTGFRLFVSERTVVPAEPPFTARKFASQSSLRVRYGLGNGVVVLWPWNTGTVHHVHSLYSIVLLRVVFTLLFCFFFLLNPNILFSVSLFLLASFGCTTYHNCFFPI